MIQGHDVYPSFLYIGRSNEIEFSSIVQETGGQLIINKCLTQIFRAYEPAKSIRVQIQGPLHFWDLLESWFYLAEGILVLPSPEPTCFGEAPLAAGAQSHFFPHISNGPFEGDLAGYR